MISFLPGPEVGRRHRRDPAQHDRRARARPAARAAPGQGHPLLRAALQGNGGGMTQSNTTKECRREPVPLRRAGVPARGRARDALALQDVRGRPRGARRQDRRAARPVADGQGGRLARPADRRGARRRRAGRLRRDARARRVRARARADRAARPPARDARSSTTRPPAPRCSRRSPPASAAPPTCPSARPTTCRAAWTVDPAQRARARAAPRRPAADGDGARVSGELAFVPDAPGADLLVGVALLDGKPVGVAIEADATGVTRRGDHAL